MKKIINCLLIANLAIIFILLLGKIELFNDFIKVFIGIIVSPIIFGVFLYYLLKPLNNIFKRKGINNSKAATLTLIIGILIIFVLLKALGEYLVIEFFEIKKVVLCYLESNELNYFKSIIFENSSFKEMIINIYSTLVSYLQNIILNVKEIFNKGMMFFSNILLIFLITFFMLKDGGTFKNKIIGIIGEKYKKTVSEILEEGDEILATYVIGQAKVALSLSTMIYIGYKIIKMPTPLLFAAITFILAFIPFVGFLISMIIPYIIAISIGFNMVIKITILFIIAQTLKGRIVVPFIMGKTMKIHPLTDIFLVVGGSAIGGPLVAFIIIPIYSLIKIVYKKLKKIGFITLVDKINKV